MYLEVDEGIDILFLENVTDPSLYRIEMYKERNCLVINIYNDVESQKLNEYNRRVCPNEEAIKGMILKLNWDGSKVTMHHNTETLFHFSNEIKFPKVNHVAVKPKFSTQINYKNTYMFITRSIYEVCKDDTEPVLVCNFEMLGKSDIVGTFMRVDFYKTGSEDDYEIKATVNGTATNASSFTISKNNEIKLQSVVQPFLNRKIKFIVDLKRHHTSIHNPSEIIPLILWSEEDVTYLESLNYVIVQNLKIHNSTFSDLANSNTCQIKCHAKTPTGFWSKVGTLWNSGFKIKNFCETTDYLRD
jgi:hypothetical protein